MNGEEERFAQEEAGPGCLRCRELRWWARDPAATTIIGRLAVSDMRSERASDVERYRTGSLAADAEEKFESRRLYYCNLVEAQDEE